jgi:hypothetical protein
MLIIPLTPTTSGFIVLHRRINILDEKQEKRGILAGLKRRIFSDYSLKRIS